jgi:hypothetical protein
MLERVCHTEKHGFPKTQARKLPFLIANVLFLLVTVLDQYHFLFWELSLALAKLRLDPGLHSRVTIVVRPFILEMTLPPRYS